MAARSSAAERALTSRAAVAASYAALGPAGLGRSRLATVATQ